MRMPWANLIEKHVKRAISEAAPVIAAEAIEQAKPEIVQQAKEEFASEFVRAMVPSPLAMAPGASTTLATSPYPLYGYDRPLWHATPTSPKRRTDSLIDVDTIRRFAKTYDVLRSCINHLKREVQAQPFIIAARDPKDDSEATKQRIAEAYNFFSKKGGLGELNETRRHYEAKILEDTLVIGAFASWKNWTKGGQLMQVIPIDAATIRPCMDAYGWPGPGQDWYEQWIMGMKVTGFQPHELVYDGLWPVTDSPWFTSPVEYLISTVLSALKADEWNRTWLTDGNTPDRLMSTPPEWNPQQVQEFTEYFNLMLAGNTSERQKIKFVPLGMQEVSRASRKDQDFQEFMLWLLRRTCAIFGVQPASLGYAGEQYKVSQENSTDATTQFGAGALLDLRKEHYDDILEDLGYGDLELVRNATAEETPLQRTERLTKAAGGAYMAINEARKEDGLDGIDGGEVILVSTTMHPLEHAVREPEPEPGAEPKAGGEDEDQNEVDEELNRWMRKSLKRVKESRPASCSFQSDVLPDETRAAIARSLESCATVEQVRSAFQPFFSESTAGKAA